MKKHKSPKAWYRVSPQNQRTGNAEIYIYDVIVDYAWDDDETTAKGFIDDLKALGANTALDLHINSPGGSVFAGLAIYNALKRHQGEVNVYIDGLAASIASVVAMAGDNIIMPDNAMLMIHDPSAFAGGTAADMRKAAEMLDQATESIISVYKAKTGLETGALAIMMAAETWLNATQAEANGFIDEIEAALPLAALAGKLNAFDLSRYNNVPPLNKAAGAGNKSINQIAAQAAGKGEPTMLTMEQVKAEHRTTYDAIFAAGKEAGIDEGKSTGIEEGKKLGAQAEAARIKEVEAQLIPGHEKLIAELKADGQTTGAQAAVKVLAAEKGLRKAQLDNLYNDQVPPVPAAPDEPDTSQEVKAAVSAMVAGGNKNRSKA